MLEGTIRRLLERHDFDAGSPDEAVRIAEEIVKQHQGFRTRSKVVGELYTLVREIDGTKLVTSPEVEPAVNRSLIDKHMTP